MPFIDEIPLEQTSQERTVESVRESTNHLLASFREKLDLLRGNSEFSQKILRAGYNTQTCFEEAIKFFGSDVVRYVAVDGTEFQEERLDMLIFFAGAYAYGGSVEFKESKVVANPPSAENDFFGLSCGIPVSEENVSQVSGELTEGGIETDSARVPQALMHFAEYYLAYSAIKKDPNIKLLLMDRTVSGDIAHLSWKMREHIEQGKIKLEKLKTSHGVISKSDLELGRMLVANPDLKIPSPRSQYLKFAAVQALIDNGPMNAEEIIHNLNASPDRRERLFKDLKKDFADCFSFSPETIDSKFVPKDSTRFYWDRLIEAVEMTANHIFNSQHKAHPLNLKSEDDAAPDVWLTPIDIDFLTLIVIYALLREAWKRNILILGIVKDSAASELVHSVLPVLNLAGLLRFENKIPHFGSDKTLLQANSVVNSAFARTPWRTFEYDVCFRTVIPVRGNAPAGECEVEGAFKNVITSERMFVKAYFQLWSGESESAVRSHVFLYDRPCYPQYDLLSQPELTLRNHDVTEETIIPAIHFSSSPLISDLVMGILHSMGVDPIPEAIGHNYPLFLADKKAKLLEVEASKACVAAVDLEIARSRLDQQILFENRFRDYRQGVESSRRSRRRRTS